jgi:hypothetical protein
MRNDSCRHDQDRSRRLLENGRSRIAEKKLLAWPTAYAKHNQIMLVSLDLHEDGIVGSDTSTHGGLDFQVVLVSEFDDFLENRLLVRGVRIRRLRRPRASGLTFDT